MAELPHRAVWAVGVGALGVFRGAWEMVVSCLGWAQGPFIWGSYYSFLLLLSWVLWIPWGAVDPVMWMLLQDGMLILK